MRKSVLIIVLVLVVAMAGMASAKTKTLKLGDCVNVYTAQHIALEKFAELVEEKTNGEVKIQIFSDSQLGDALTQIESLKMGTLDMFSGGLGWLGQFNKDYNVMATAFVMKDINHVDRVLESEIGQEMADVLKDKHGLRVLNATWHRPPRSLLTVNKEVHSVEDVQGLMLRVPDLPSFTIPWSLMGATTTPISWSETYLALSQGVVDSMEGFMEDLYTSRLHEPANYLSLTTHQYENVALLMSERVFKKLNAEQQQALIEAAKEAGLLNNELTEKSDEEFKKKLEEDGITIIYPDRASFFEKGKEIPYVLAEKGLWSKGLYDRIKELAD